MIKKGSFSKYTIILQAFILLFAIATIPVGAASESAPSFPIIAEGDITIGGEAAPVGTEITVKLGDKTVGMTTVESEGIFGDAPNNRLLITSEPDDYQNLKFYVNGVETDLIDLTNAAPGDTISTSLSADASAASSGGTTTTSTTEATTSSSSSSSFGSMGTGSSDATPSEVESFESTAFAGDEAGAGDTTIGSSPSADAESSAVVSGLFGLILVSLIGIVVLVKHRKN
ncbi:hypothetical protein J2755_002077 [Methanohalophilus levihalophilus]|uniref:hypothetical protein n=1 Tax=Methanohalophilus levihalophilus TaxID=1431282 RepID=UPI001AE8F291|nr:hypothetical protein [Methanohalophilus levihalophilus]MBP2031129.1 hypothetical protein [Methanohalophilus levihalophilus]